MTARDAGRLAESRAICAAAWTRYDATRGKDHDTQRRAREEYDAAQERVERLLGVYPLRNGEDAATRRESRGDRR